MNDRLPQLLETVSREGFRVHQWCQVAYGQTWVCVLQYPSRKFDHAHFSVRGQGKSAGAALEAALNEGRPMMKKHGAPQIDPEIADLLG